MGGWVDSSYKAAHSSRLVLLYLPITHPPTHPPTHPTYLGSELLGDTQGKGRLPCSGRTREEEGSPSHLFGPGGWVGGWVGGGGGGGGGGEGGGWNEVLDAMGGLVGGWVGGWKTYLMSSTTMPAASRAFSWPTRPAPMGRAAPLTGSRPRPCGWVGWVSLVVGVWVVWCGFGWVGGWEGKDRLPTLMWVCTATRCVLVVDWTSSICVWERWVGGWVGGWVGWVWVAGRQHQSIHPHHPLPHTDRQYLHRFCSAPFLFPRRSLMRKAAAPAALAHVPCSPVWCVWWRVCEKVLLKKGWNKKSKPPPSPFPTLPLH